MVLDRCHAVLALTSAGVRRQAAQKLEQRRIDELRPLLLDEMPRPLDE
jgi:hypothetical protein